MQLFEFVNEEECPWYHFDSSYKTLLGSCLIVFGVFGVLLNGWLFATFIHSHLLVFRSHILVANLCTASLGRNLLGFPFSGSSAIAKRWLFGPACCQLYAFLNQFFGVFQMTAFFVLVLERYLLAKRYRREKKLNYRFYGTFVGLCWVNSLLFSIPPLFGFGTYSCDATGTACTFLWPSLASGTKPLGYTVPYIFICAVIPVITIFFFMGKAIRLEKIYYRSVQQKEQKRLTLRGRGMCKLCTYFISKLQHFDIEALRRLFMSVRKSIHALVVVTFALWVPAAALALWQWLPLLALGYRPHVPPALPIITAIASEAATSVPALCYLVADERLKAALLGRMKSNYALLPPEKAKLFNSFKYNK